MRITLFIFIFGVFLPNLVRASLPIGDGKVGAILHYTISWDSNLDARQNGRSDFLQTAGISFNYRRYGAIGAIEASTAFDYTSYKTYDAENAIEPNIKITYTRNRGRLKLIVDTGYAKRAIAPKIANLRTEVQTFDFGSSLELPAAARFGMELHTDYSANSYRDDTLLDQSTASVALKSRYIVSSKTDTFIAVTTTTATTGTQKAHTQTAAGGLSGKLTPKISGTLSAGFTKQSGTTALYLDTDLKWTAPHEVTVQTSLNQALENSVIDGEVLKTKTLAVNLSKTIHGYAVQLGLSKAEAKTQNRNDDIFGQTASVTRELTRRWSVTANAIWTQTQTDAFGKYQRTTSAVKISCKI